METKKATTTPEEQLKEFRRVQACVHALDLIPPGDWAVGICGGKLIGGGK